MKTRDLIIKAAEEVRFVKRTLNNEIKYFKDRLAVLRLVPVELLPEHTTTSFLWSSIYIYMPWDVPAFQAFQHAMLERGFEDYSHYDTDDKSSEYHHYKLPGSRETIVLVVEAKRKGSKCVLVPIETKQEVKVITYDKVCPDGHPELFHKNDKGELEYVGDQLFPAVKTE